jgi:regulatory protein
MAHPPRKERRPPPEPTLSVLHDAAVAYLAKYGATQAGVVRVLDRRIARWAAATGDPESRAAAAKTAARAIVAKLAEGGAVDDSAFAAARARSLQRAGKSSRAIGAHLAAKGVPAPLAHAALPDDEAHELAAAVIHARKRRLGPFRKTGDATPELRRRELGSLARAGFGHAVARAALALSWEEAEALMTRFRADL